MSVVVTVCLLAILIIFSIDEIVNFPMIIITTADGISTLTISCNIIVIIVGSSVFRVDHASIVAREELIVEGARNLLVIRLVLFHVREAITIAIDGQPVDQVVLAFGGAALQL